MKFPWNDLSYLMWFIDFYFTVIIFFSCFLMKWTYSWNIMQTNTGLNDDFLFYHLPLKGLTKECSRLIYPDGSLSCCPNTSNEDNMDKKVKTISKCFAMFKELPSTSSALWTHKPRFGVHVNQHDKLSRVLFYIFHHYFVVSL